MKSGWQTKTLGEVCAVKGGKRVPKGYKLKNALTAHPYISVADFTNNGTISREKIRYIDPEVFEQIKNYTITSDDLYLSIAGTIGKTGFVPPDLSGASLTENACKLVLGPEVDKKFLYHFTRSSAFSEHVETNTRTAAQPKLSLERLKTIPIPLPPLKEQQLIVAVLDEAFEGLARARSHAEANLRNAQELSESYASLVFRPRDGTEECPYSTTIKAVCDIQSGAGFPLQFQGKQDGEYPFYKVSDMNLAGNEWELHVANNYISDEVRRHLRARVFPHNSIVFPKVGGAIATNKKRIVQFAACVDNNVMGLIPDETKVVPAYLHEWLRAFDIYEFSNKANPPSITQGTVAGWPLRVPSRAEQLRVVAFAERLREQTQGLLESYRERIKNLDDLRQSLLHKAFAGELI